MKPYIFDSLGKRKYTNSSKLPRHIDKLDKDNFDSSKVYLVVRPSGYECLLKGVKPTFLGVLERIDYGEFKVTSSRDCTYVSSTVRKSIIKYWGSSTSGLDLIIVEFDKDEYNKSRVLWELSR